VRHQQETAYADFINSIRHSRDLPLAQKLHVLNYVADEMYVQDNNLLFLECKQALKELSDEAARG
jgi:hypothetical protein